MSILETLLVSAFAVPEPYTATIAADISGAYSFDGVPCCAVCGYDEYEDVFRFGGFRGDLSVAFQMPGVGWTLIEAGSFDCCEETGGTEPCEHDVRLPTRWGTMEGTVFPEAGTALADDVELEVWLYGGEGGQNQKGVLARGEMRGAIAIGAGEYTFDVPLGNGGLVLDPGATRDPLWRSYAVSYEGEVLTADTGEGALGTVIGTLFSPGGIDPEANAFTDVSLYCDQLSATATTDAAGVFAFADVPTGECTVYSAVNYDWSAGYLDAKDTTLVVDINGVDAEVFGVVYGWDGIPMPGHEVYLSMWGGSYVDESTVTNASGAFSFTGLPTGSGSLAAGYEDPVSGEFLSAGVSFHLPSSGVAVQKDVVVLPPTGGDAVCFQYDYWYGEGSEQGGSITPGGRLLWVPDGP